MQHIGNACYILPYGQNVADHKRGISINDTGEYIWELLKKEISREELQQKYLDQFMIKPEEKGGLIKDLDEFLNQLIRSGFIEDGDKPLPVTGRPCARLGIGGLTLEYYGPKKLIDASFLKEFCIKTRESADMRVFISWDVPGSSVGGNILIETSELIVCEKERHYLLSFPSFSKIRGVELSKDGSAAVFYCTLPCDEELGTEFFHALRQAFLYLAKKHNMYAIHSASLCYQGKAWLFSASAGTGKSTHTNMWKELYDVELLNGDLNLLAIEDGRPVVHGIPWCGTSEIFTKKTVPLGGIMLLKRDAVDTIEELSPDKQALLVMQRFISPVWTAVQFKSSVAYAKKLAGKILVCRLHCTKNNSAAATSKSRIDRELSK